MAAIISQQPSESLEGSECGPTGFDVRMRDFLQMAIAKLEDKTAQVNGCKDKYEMPSTYSLKMKMLLV